MTAGSGEWAVGAKGALLVTVAGLIQYGIQIEGLARAETEGAGAWGFAPETQ
eukprot:SAG31_NODE_4682_length_3034_cov_4.466780_4_plen_52_part_00